jgi:hypothetical protein
MTTASAELLADLLAACKMGHSALDRLMGDTDWPDADAYEVQAALAMMAAITKAEAGLTRAVQPASKPVGDGGAVRDALATLIKYAVWQVKEGADHHPTLPSAVAAAEAALTRAVQPADSPAAGDVERMRDALAQAEACMSIVEPRSDKAEYLRILGVVRAALAAPAPAPDTCPHCIDERDCANVPICAAVAETYAAPPPDAVAVPKEMIEMVIGRIDHVHNWLAGWQHFEQCDHLLLARKALDRARSAAHASPGDGSTGGRG